MTLWAFLPVLSLHTFHPFQKILSIPNNSALEGTSPLTDCPGSWEVCLFTLCWEEKKNHTQVLPSVNAAVWQSDLAHVLNSILDLQLTVRAGLVSSSVKGRSQFPRQRVAATTKSDKGSNSPALLPGSYQCLGTPGGSVTPWPAPFFLLPAHFSRTHQNSPIARAGICKYYARQIYFNGGLHLVTQRKNTH